MKWILSYKLFEDVNRYGYEGNIIDIDKNELQECIIKLNEFFRCLLGTHDIVELISYKDGAQNIEDKYAYAANFTEELIPVNSVTEDYDNIIGMLTMSLFKDYRSVNNCLKLLKLDNNFDNHGYSVIFTNDPEFRTNFLKKGSKLKIPNNKNKVLVNLICYYVAHLENMGDSVSYGAGKKQHAPIFRNLLINYCEYLLKYNRAGKDLLTKIVSMDDVYTVVYDTIVNSGSRYELLNSIKILQPDFYHKLLGLGDEISMNMAADMGDMGFTEGNKWIKTYKIFESTNSYAIKTSMDKFNLMFNITGLNITQSGNDFLINFNYLSDGCVFKYFLVKLANAHGIEDPKRVWPVNVNGGPVKGLEIYLKASSQGANEPPDKTHFGFSSYKGSSGNDTYTQQLKPHSYNKGELMNLFLKGACGVFGNVNDNTRNIYIHNLVQSNIFVEVPFIRISVYKYLKEVLKNDYANIDTPVDFFYKSIYDEVIKTGNNSYRYFNLMKGSPLYEEMVKLSNGSGIELTDGMTDMGFSD